MNKNKTMPAVEFFLKYPGPKGVRVIDVASERKKPVYMSDEEYEERLSRYTLEDYLHSEEPYYDLIEVSRGQVGLYDQYAHVLMDAIRSKTGSGHFLQRVADEVEYNRWVFIQGARETNSILGFISQVEADADMADKVSVLPLMCGAGKSTAITLLMKQVIERVIEKQDNHGLLVVTDSNKRLDELWNEDTANPLLGKNVRAFIKEHKNDVTIMKAETYDKAVRTANKCPVLVMTTQRYFNILTKNEIKQFLSWQNQGTRPLILFDEEPYLNEVCDLTPKTVNNIDTMLRMVLDESNTKKEDKQWCVQQWSLFREKFLRSLWEYEYDHAGDMFYHEDVEHTMTEDDERFFSIIDRCKTDIRADDIENYKNLFACRAFANNWGVYSYRTAGAYESKFTVFLDNRDKVQELGAKVIVLDATGDISPMYKGLDYIDMRSGINYTRSLSHLKIKLVDMDTSKAKMFTRKSPVPPTTTAFLRSEGYNSDNAYIFTYKGREDKFTAFKNRTAHLGGIKGSNEYADAECIAQVGLNELQPVHYFVHTLARNDALRTSLSGLSPEENWARIQEIMSETDNCADIKVAHILSDIDQNMFRSAIRTAKNRKDVAFYLFYKNSHMPQLRSAIFNRYCRLLGGKLKSVSANIIASFEPPKTETVADKIYQWYCQWNGELINRKTILQQLGITADAFKKNVTRDRRLTKLFSDASENAKRADKPRGWYKK